METGKVARGNTAVLMENFITNVPSRLNQLITVSWFVGVAQGWGGAIHVTCSNIMTRLVTDLNFVKNFRQIHYGAFCRGLRDSVTSGGGDLPRKKLNHRLLEQQVSGD